MRLILSTANQETIVELVEFVKRIALQRSKKTLNGKMSPIEELDKTVTEKEEVCYISCLI